jgi:hypothetical protein
MWLRTTMNYQYANGGSLTNAITTLYKEGGVARFYRGGVAPGHAAGCMVLGTEYQGSGFRVRDSGFRAPGFRSFVCQGPGSRV